MFVNQPCHLLCETAKVNTISIATCRDYKVLLSFMLDKVTAELFSMSIDTQRIEVHLSTISAA